MRKHLLTWLFAAVFMVTAGSGYAGALKALSQSSVQTADNMAVLYFDSTSRLDVSIMAEFIKDCGEQQGITCICAESSGTDDAEVIKDFEGTANEPCLYRGTAPEAMPVIEFYKEGKVVGSIGTGGNFAGLTGIYLRYISGVIDRAALDAELKEAETAQEYKKIIPRMQFVLMLAKKGEIESAVSELDKMSAYNLDNRGKLLLGETYLRLKSPVKAISILSRCDDTDCAFYRGVAEYLAGDTDHALSTLQGLKGTYSDQNKLNYYLKKIYEAKGDIKHADEIRLPENYNIDSE